MAKRKSRMPTIWEVDDELWQQIQPIIRADMPTKPTGRPPVSYTHLTLPTSDLV